VRLAFADERKAKTIDANTLINKILLPILVATFHGYLAAWLAVRMLFRPRYPVKLFGFTVWPQGMIPRHRERLAETIGKAVGTELVSEETVTKALFETDFFRSKVESFISGYTENLLNTSHPSLVEALPPAARAPVLDAISALQLRVGAHIADVLKSEETTEAVNAFVDRRTDEILGRRLSDVLDEETFTQILEFVETRFRNIVTENSFETKVRDFVGARVDEILHSRARLAEIIAPDTVGIIKERIDAQVPPIVSQLAEIATQKKTRTQIGALIKREVDDYYQQLSFFKKIFVSRERIHSEVDDMVNKTLPRRVEEFLRGEAFEQEAEAFLNSTIDNVLAQPLSVIVGRIAPEKLELIKDDLSRRIIQLAQSPELERTVSAYATDALYRIRPHSLRAILEHASPDSADRLKSFLSRGLLSILSSEETARTINSILSAQIERLLVTPVGRLSDHLPKDFVENASAALTDRIVSLARERLPVAINEFDIGGIVRRKVSEYPVEKLEELVLSISKQHLRVIELFGLAMGFFIGIAQAVLILVFL
jgi:uncharacterized membrane protein YheB (UPF0754 family)